MIYELIHLRCMADVRPTKINKTKGKCESIWHRRTETEVDSERRGQGGQEGLAENGRAKAVRP